MGNVGPGMLGSLLFLMLGLQPLPLSRGRFLHHPPNWRSFHLGTRHHRNTWEQLKSCEAAFDLYFIVDASQKTNNIWKDINKLVDEIVKKYTNPDLRMSFITYSTQGNIIMKLTSDRQEISRGLSRLQNIVPTGATNMQEGLIKANKQIQQATSGKSSASSLIITLTAGPLLPWTLQDTKKEAQQARDMGAKVYCLGVKDYKRDQLHTIVERKDQMYGIDEFNSAETLVASLVKNSCMEMMAGDTHFVCLGEAYDVTFSASGLHQKRKDEIVCRYQFGPSKVYERRPISINQEKLICPGHMFNKAGQKVFIDYSLNNGVTFVDEDLKIAVKNCGNDRVGLQESQWTEGEMEEDKTWKEEVKPSEPTIVSTVVTLPTVITIRTTVPTVVLTTTVPTSVTATSTVPTAITRTTTVSTFVPEETTVPELGTEEETIVPEVVLEEETTVPVVVPEDDTTFPEAVPEEETTFPHMVSKEETFPQVVPEDDITFPQVVPEGETFPQAFPEEETFPQVVPEDETTFPEVFPEEEATFPQIFPGKETTFHQEFPENEAIFPRVFPEYETTFPQVFRENEATFPEVLQEDEATFPEVLPEDEITFPEVSAEDETAFPEVFPEEEIIYTSSPRYKTTVPMTIPKKETTETTIVPEEETTVPVVASKETTVSTVVPKKETTVPAIVPEEKTTAPMTVPEEETTLPNISPEEETTAPMTVPEEETTLPSISPEEETVMPTIVTEETTAPMTVPEEETTLPSISPEEETMVPTTVTEETTAPTAVPEEETIMPNIFPEEETTVPTIVTEEITAPIVVPEEETIMPNVLPEEETMVPTTVTEETTAPMVMPEEETAMTNISPEEETTVPTIITEETTAPMVVPEEEITIPEFFPEEGVIIHGAVPEKITLVPKVVSHSLLYRTPLWVPVIISALFLSLFLSLLACICCHKWIVKKPSPAQRPEMKPCPEQGYTTVIIPCCECQEDRIRQMEGKLDVFYNFLQHCSLVPTMQCPSRDMGRCINFTLVNSHCAQMLCRSNICLQPSQECFPLNINCSDHQYPPPICPQPPSRMLPLIPPTARNLHRSNMSLPPP